MSSQNYNLNDLTDGQPKSKLWPALIKLVGLLPEKRGQLILALITMVFYSILSMLPPALIGYTVNHLIADKVNIRGLSIQTTFISKILHGTGYSLVLTVCGWLLVIYLLLNWLPTLMISRGFAPAQAQLLSLAFNLAAAAGSILLGMATDRLGPARTVPVAYFLMLAAAVLVAVANSYGAYLAGFTAMGFLLLGGQNCLNGVIPNFYPAEARTLSVGAAVGTGRIGSVVGPLYAGFVLAGRYGARAVLESIVALVAVAAVLVLFLLLDGRRRMADFGK